MFRRNPKKRAARLQASYRLMFDRATTAEDRVRELEAQSGRQYEFRDGHFVDTWNEYINDSTHLPYPNDGGWPEAILEGICGCGSPELIVDAMGEYLQRVEQRSAQRPATRPLIDPCRVDTPDFLADYLIASMADDLGLTEHGGSIFGSWLDDAGKRWLELWRNRTTEETR